MNPVYKDPRPIPASTASRSKLDAFRFKNDNENGVGAGAKTMKTSPQKGHTDKENQTSWLNGVVEQDEPKPDNLPNLPGPSEAKALKDCPQTPGNRLPLADLIGNAEDAFSRAPVGQELTPEYVTWQHGPPSSNPSSQTPATQSKKRRHSSSPTSSPLASSKRANTGSFNLQSIQTLLKTPQNDLAADLWNNYVAKSTANMPDLQQPRFANLLSSSPHTPGSARAGESSGLRRSLSCNAEWPSSNAKRKKLEAQSHPKGRAMFSRSRSNVMVPNHIKASNFSSLVQEMEKSLKKFAPNQSDSSKAASAAPHTKTRRSRSASPLETKFTKPAPSDKDQDHTAMEAPEAPSSKLPGQESSSDFGADDILDDEFLGLAEASMDPFVEPTQMRSTSASNTDYGHIFSSNGAQHFLDDVNHAIPPEANNKTDGSRDVDEFDDDFEEGFSDNIDDLLAGCDQTPSNRHPKTVQSQPTVPNHSSKQEGLEEKTGHLGPSQDGRNEQHFTSSDEFDDDDFDMDCLDQPVPQGEENPDDVRHS